MDLQARVALLAAIKPHVIIQVPVGSTIHGLHLEGTDDRDEMGICTEPIGLAVGFKRFEQVVYRTAEIRTGKHDAPSQPGDLDLVVYSLRKWLTLAMEGNPTVINLMFVPHFQQVVSSEIGLGLQAVARTHMVNRGAGNRFLGYLRKQRERLIGERGQKRIKRPELILKYGYDTKYAMHMLRLGYQGIELLETGKITLPMREPDRSHVRDVRLGKSSKAKVLEECMELESRLTTLLTTSHIPPEPDREKVEQWMLQVYRDTWFPQVF